MNRYICTIQLPTSKVNTKMLWIKAQLYYAYVNHLNSTDKTLLGFCFRADNMMVARFWLNIFQIAFMIVENRLELSWTSVLLSTLQCVSRPITGTLDTKLDWIALWENSTAAFTLFGRAVVKLALFWIGNRYIH